MSQWNRKKKKRSSNEIVYLTHCLCCGELKQIDDSDSVALLAALNNNDLIIMSGNDIELIKGVLKNADVN
jgi:hypothetical protein